MFLEKRVRRGYRRRGPVKLSSDGYGSPATGIAKLRAALHIVPACCAPRCRARPWLRSPWPARPSVRGGRHRPAPRAAADPLLHGRGARHAGAVRLHQRSAGRRRPLRGGGAAQRPELGRRPAGRRGRALVTRRAATRQGESRPTICGRGSWPATLGKRWAVAARGWPRPTRARHGAVSPARLAINFVQAAGDHRAVRACETIGRRAGRHAWASPIRRWRARGGAQGRGSGRAAKRDVERLRSAGAEIVIALAAVEHRGAAAGARRGSRLRRARAAGRQAGAPRAEQWTARSWSRRPTSCSGSDASTSCCAGGGAAGRRGRARRGGAGAAGRDRRRGRAPRRRPRAVDGGRRARDPAFVAAKRRERDELDGRAKALAAPLERRRPPAATSPTA